MKYLFAAIAIIVAGLGATVPALAETFSEEVLEPVAHNQTFDQVLRYTRQKASRRALERAGAFISSHTTVQNGRLTRDEINSMTAGIVKLETVEATQVIKGGLLYAKVRMLVGVDPEDVRKHILRLQQDHKRMEELRKEQQRVQELEGELQVLVKKQKQANETALAERMRIKTALESALKELEGLRARQARGIPHRSGPVDLSDVRLIDPVPGSTPGLPMPQKVE